MEEEISLIDIAYTIMAKWPALLISMITAAAIAFAGTLMFIAPKYESTGKLYVSSEGSHAPQNDTVNYNTVMTNQRLVSTYMEILRSNSFLDTVSEDIGGKYSYSSIQSMLSMQALNNTELLQITVKCKNPYDAYRIAQSIIKNSGDEIERVVEGGSVRIIDNASMPSSPSSPNVPKNTAVGALAGLVLCAGAVFMMSILDTRVKAGDDMQAKYSIPVLGEIPWILETK